jgi:hypothetical protein
VIHLFIIVCGVDVSLDSILIFLLRKSTLFVDDGVANGKVSSEEDGLKKEE